MNVQCIQKQTTPGRYPVWRADVICGKCAFYVRETAHDDREYGHCAMYVNNPNNDSGVFYVSPLYSGCQHCQTSAVRYGDWQEIRRTAKIEQL